MHVAAVLTAAGSGLRLGFAEPKALVSLSSVPLLVHAAQRLRQADVGDLVVTTPPDHLAQVEQLLSNAGIGDVRCRPGGVTRQHSVALALELVDPQAEFIVVHDAARALAPPVLIDRVVQALRDGADAVIPGLPVADTIKSVAGRIVTGTPDRAALVAVQTPQGFRSELLRRAHRLGAALATTDEAASDDAGLVERFTEADVSVVPGMEQARKITTAVDLALAQTMVSSGGWA
ncbi:MAG: 2-C-methyl-D-erythritol 4-phosphate cytidylyltransferase [Beutenbergiaceae bacterium]